MNLLNYLIPRIGVLKDVQMLVIDSDRDSLHLYAVLLEDCGANVVTAVSIKEALEFFAWLMPNILICDMWFRTESIDTLTSKLSEMEKSTGNHIFAIATTTFLTDSLAQILDLGFDGYLLKPIDLDALVSIIEFLLYNKFNFSNVLQD